MEKLTPNAPEIILQQLGGNKFIAMTGVKNLMSDGSIALTMHIGRNKSKAKYLRIEITQNDTYNMIFRTQDKKNFSFPIVSSYQNVYADMLKNIFTKETGLLTSL